MANKNQGIDIARKIFKVVCTDGGKVSVTTFEKNFTTNFSRVYCIFTDKELSINDLPAKSFKQLERRWTKIAKDTKLDDIYYCLNIENEMEIFSCFNDDHKEVLIELDLKKAFLQLIADTYLENTPQKERNNNVLFRLMIKIKIISLIIADIKIGKQQQEANKTYDEIKKDVNNMLTWIREQHEKDRQLVQQNRIKKCMYAYYEIKKNFKDIDMEEVINIMDLKYDEETKEFLHYCIRIQERKQYDLTDEEKINELINDATEIYKKDKSEEAKANTM